jgi:hypothetical protein
MSVYARVLVALITLGLLGLAPATNRLSGEASGTEPSAANRCTKSARIFDAVP